MLKIVEILQQKGTDHKTLLIVSCSIYSFLIWVSETNETVFFKIRSDIWMLKIVEILKQKGTDHKTLLIVSCSIYSFLTWVSETNQTVLSKIQPDIWMLKIVEIFQHFPKIFTQLEIFLVSHQCFLFFYLAPKEFFSLNKINSCSCSNWLKYYIKMLTLKLSAILLYHSGGVRNYFLYKAQIYLPTKDIKLFGQNGWSFHTWESWLLSKDINYGIEWINNYRIKSILNKYVIDFLFMNLNERKFFNEYKIFEWN